MENFKISEVLQLVQRGMYGNIWVWEHQKIPEDIRLSSHHFSRCVIQEGRRFDPHGLIKRQGWHPRHSNNNVRAVHRIELGWPQLITAAVPKGYKKRIHLNQHITKVMTQWQFYFFILCASRRKPWQSTWTHICPGICGNMAMKLCMSEVNFGLKENQLLLL